MTTVNPDFMSDLKKLGAFDVSACYSCGICTAICPLSKEKHEFPRKLIRYSILGLEDKIKASPDPWMCYYCGECTDSCPRQADPAGFMMALRRYLTTKYDFSGISRTLYASKWAEWAGIILLSFIALLSVYLLHGPIVTHTVQLATFAPVEIVETADIIVLAVLGTLLMINLYRMYRFTVMSVPGKIPLKSYITELIRTLPIYFFTQSKFRSCKSGTKDHIYHLTRFIGYAMIFVLGVFLMALWQTDRFYPVTSPIMIVQYVAAALLLLGISPALYGRIKKAKNMYRYSHSTDWMFLLLLLAAGVTGVLIVVFRYAYMAWATYVIYTIHLMIVTSLLVLEVPFAKWSHMAYRTFAPYFSRLIDVKMSGTARQ